MTIDTLLANFDRLAEAPNGIQKLRELILQLAVRGKLVPQDPNDEPASELLKRIRAEKQRLIDEGKIRKSKSLPPFTRGTSIIPASWEWTRIREITHDLGQKIPGGPFTYIDVSTIDKKHGRISDATRVLEANQAPSRARKLVAIDSVIYSTVRPYLLNIAVVNKEFKPAPIVSTAFAVLHPFAGISSYYLYYYLRSPLFIEYVNSAMTGMAYPAINDAKMSVGPVPLPPFSEQKRIVAKVDELMALCDELEAKQQAKRKKQIALNRASLHALTQPNGTSIATAWQRVRDHFNDLYTVPETVSELRQTILQLAVMGHLVPQDPNDEPGSELLKKIHAEKQRLIAEGKIRKPKTLPSVKPDELPFAPPIGWAWVRLGNITAEITKGSSPKWQGVQYVQEGDGILFITSENVGTEKLRLVKRKYVEPRFNEIEPRSILETNDILMNIVGASIGRTALFNLGEIANINQAVCLIRLIKPNVLLCLRYLLSFANSDVCRGYMFDRQVDMARANLSMGNIAKFMIPLPPLTEQKRIVAKVDRLMGLCHNLEAKLQQAQTDADNLLAAIVPEVVGGTAGGSR